MIPWSLQMTAHCSKIDGDGLSCMTCLIIEEQHTPATGHVRICGGPFDGRVILVVCRECASKEQDAVRIRKLLVKQAMEGLFDPFTGGPGVIGVPEMWHHDHWDLLQEAQHSHGGE